MGQVLKLTVKHEKKDRMNLIYWFRVNGLVIDIRTIDQNLPHDFSSVIDAGRKEYFEKAFKRFIEKGIIERNNLIKDLYDVVKQSAPTSEILQLGVRVKGLDL